MAITARCVCGYAVSLQDEYAGRTFACPSCGQGMRAAAPERRPQADPAFDRDKFLLRQKHLSISEKYYVWDEAGQPLLFVERPAHFLKSLLAMLAFAGTFLVLAIVVIVATIAVSQVNEGVAVAVGILGFIAIVAVAIAVAIMLSPKRHVNFYRDDTRQEQVLTILQDKKAWLLSATYSVLDANENLLARLEKNYLYNLFRKRWNCRAADGSLLCVANEDSLVLSLLRRVLGTFFGLLRANFVLQAGDTDQMIGAFNRQFTLLDRYVLDLSRDPQRTLDRRVALAIGVMLDTGERR